MKEVPPPCPHAFSGPSPSKLLASIPPLSTGSQLPWSQSAQQEAEGEVTFSYGMCQLHEGMAALWTLT